MALESELVRLVLYATQQLGVTLAVGAQTIVLLAYLIAMRDRVVEAKEAQFARAARAVLFSGLGLVILSGLGIAALHYIGAEFSILLAPAFLFKWILVVAVLLFGLGIGAGWVWQWVGEGIVGGTWYALFLVHILAPVTSWETLGVLYAGWLGAFFLIWTALVFGTRERVTTIATAVKKVAPPPVKIAPEPPKSPPVPLALPNIPIFKKPEPVLPPVAPPPLPAPIVKIENPPTLVPKPEQKTSGLNEHPGLPAIRVMPKTPEDIDKQHRPAVVKPQ